MANEIGDIGGSAATGAGIGSMVPGIGTAIGASAGGLLGILKAIMDSNNERKDRIMQATTTRYSPWTGLKAQAVSHSNGVGDAAAGVAGGAQLAQGLQKGSADNDVTQAIAARLRAPSRISTPAESGAAPPAPAPAAAAPASPDPAAQFSTGQDAGNGADLDQIMKLLRMAQGGRQSLGRYNA